MRNRNGGDKFLFDIDIFEKENKTNKSIEKGFIKLFQFIK